MLHVVQLAVFRQELDKRDAILRETRASLAKAAAENADLAAQIAELKKVLSAIYPLRSNLRVTSFDDRFVCVAFSPESV